MPHLRFRQIHLDFHTSPAISGIGEKFNKKRWQETLRRAEVDSVTCFSKCHHGWSYHPTAIGKRHPNLSFDLLRAQYDACKEIGINVPIYLSAGVDNLASLEHPEWREIDFEGQYSGAGRSPLQPGFHKMDFHSPYLTYLCEQIEEAVALFPDCDGVFLDIIRQGESCSRWAMEYMKKAGLNPECQADRKSAAQAALQSYFERTTGAARTDRADRAVVHNSGHIFRGRRDLLAFQNHLELESLPTGGWGYDHFPESALYAATLGLPYLGMTGKFHTTWGEFGGLKHPNALRYECAAMLAFGAACSVGDQLHPSGELDASTYEVIGAAYREVAAKETWCQGFLPVAQIGVLSSESEHPETARHNAPDTGATRLLLESHHLFTLIDRQSDFDGFELMILPDDIRLDEPLAEKLQSYLKEGGKIFLSGESGLRQDSAGFALETGAEWHGASEFQPDYLLPNKDLSPDFSCTSFITYGGSQRIRANEGESLGQIFDPWFNRTYDHFCSHQHAPSRLEASGFDGGVQHGNVLVLAHPVFTAYRAYGQVILRHFVERCLQRLLGGRKILETNLPSMARATLTQHEGGQSWVVHLLYASLVSRGGALSLDGGNGKTQGRSLEVIEDLLPLRDVRISLALPKSVEKVMLEPGGTKIPFKEHGGRIEILVPEFTCHQMVVFHAR